MFVPFNTLPAASRIWIYQADRPFSADETAAIEQWLRQYCEDWAAHGQPLKASFRLAHGLFIILAVDEGVHQASGCSIDTSVQAIREIGARTRIDFFNRELIAFHDNGHGARFIPLRQLRQAYASGLWNDTTLVFDNVVPTKGDLDHGWLKPASSTWLRRYIPAEAVKG